MSIPSWMKVQVPEPRGKEMQSAGDIDIQMTTG